MSDSTGTEYDSGGWLLPGLTRVCNDTSEPEPVPANDERREVP